jgi:hypothetical protein
MKIFTFIRVIDVFWDAAACGLINVTDVSKAASYLGTSGKCLLVDKL